MANREIGNKGGIHYLPSEQSETVSMPQHCLDLEERRRVCFAKALHDGTTAKLTELRRVLWSILVMPFSRLWTP
jgi:hypothetical protein